MSDAIAMVTTINVSGLAQLDRLIGLTQSDVSGAIGREFSDTGANASLLTIMQNAITEVGLHHRTHWLADSAFVQPEHTWPPEVTVGYTADYAKYQDEGTRYLPARHFLALAAQKMQPQIEERINHAIREVVEAHVIGRGRR